MKIKSHTGEMVLCRPLMICFALGKVFTIKTCVSSDDDWIVMDDGSYIEPSECTLLHCPFQVGDEIHDYLGISQQYSRAPLTITMQEFADAANAGEIDIIHADPNLRDAPEYKP